MSKDEECFFQTYEFLESELLNGNNLTGKTAELFFRLSIIKLLHILTLYHVSSATLTCLKHININGTQTIGDINETKDR